ncbi:hypothetical protein PPTG_08988 [Phytophthora nicotianae INRA-310]|uniref:Crinkler effector protein N-terminal domain-containing protein n=2 Tax=Phytophthora nicotianae TaxID=4792 RepID=W2QKD1_PHYN3|nr:hypothetical protein PPTG_08988 [Phytophthora nicotianae INRA-310]ETN13004.1 hypothetical protein PPTG_08988 [Phytophthora nicotianae INRA-310]
MPLKCVDVALPLSIRSLEHVYKAVNAYLIPPTLDGAVRHGCLGVLERFKTKPFSSKTLYAAIDNKHFSTVKWVLTDRKSDFKTVILDDALRQVIKRGESEIVELMVDHCSDNAVENALSYAAYEGKWQIVRVLYMECMPGCDALGDTLNQAAIMGERDVVELLWRGCDEKDVARSLESAAMEGKWDVVEVLYQHCDTETRKLGVVLLCAIEKGKWDMVEVLYPRCREKDLVEALKVVVIQHRWDVAKLLCRKLQKKEYEDALQLVDRDEGRLLLDRLYRRCKCFQAEKAVMEATKRFNWMAIKLLADACYKKSATVDKAFKLAIEMEQWDVVKRLYPEYTDEAVSEATKKAEASGKPETARILQNNSSMNDATTSISQRSLSGEKDVEIPEAKPELQMIRCVVPGFDPFEIDISLVDRVDDLKKLLHTERPDYFGDVPADSIRFYLAKRGDEWLSEDSEDIDLLAIGDGSRVRDLLVWQVMPSRHVQAVFKDVPRGNTIHVIALKPMLRCIIPGSRPFGINIDTIMQIGYLKKVIKEEMAGDFDQVDASEIQLYLAKENGKWLPPLSGGAKALMVGEVCPSLGNILARQLMSMTEVGNPFADVFAIHIIVFSPHMNLSAYRDVPSSRRFRWDQLNNILHDAL